MFALMTFALVLTWVVPSGTFEMQPNEAGQTVVVPGTYTQVEAKDYLHPVSLFTVVPRALADAQGIIFFVLIIGGSIKVIRETGAIDAWLGSLLQRFGDRPKWLLFSMLLTFALASATIGVAEEYIPFAIILVGLCVAMRLDAIAAIGTLVVGYGIGYGIAFMNPFTLVVAQNVAGLPPLSGFEYRLALVVPFVAVGFHHVWGYVRRIQADPSASLMAGVGESPVALAEPVANSTGDRTGKSMSNENAGASSASLSASPATTSASSENVAENQAIETPDAAPTLTAAAAAYPEMTGSRKAVLGATLLALAILIWGIAAQGWYLVELGALFLILAIVTGLISRMGVNMTAETFARGAAELTSTALLIGFARSIALLMEDGVVLHTVVHALATPLAMMGAELAAVGMLFIQSGLNFFIPSGSGQAFVAMPLMAPIGDLVGVSRQVAVLAFQFGDGLMNMIVPTNPVLMGILGLAGIPYSRWLRFIGPLVLKLLALSAAALVVAVWIGYA
ncbi:MAG: YfcC family protein [Bacteroidetes bacterium]|nr:YfcC family protein [Bacteroidota bacterium]